MPEREEGGLVLVKQTFVGPLDVLDEAARLRAVSGVKTGTLGSRRESSSGSSSVSLNKFLPHSLVTYPLSFPLSNPRN